MGTKYIFITGGVVSSLGKGIVLDTGDFAKNNPEQVDIATNW